MSQGKLFQRCATVTKTIFHVVSSRKGNKFVKAGVNMNRREI